MYTKKTYYLKNSIQIEKGHATGKGRHDPRQKRQSPTSEQMKNYNETQAARKLNRKICANFGPGDFHLILTYKPEFRVPEDESRKILKKFLNNLRRDYKKLEAELKYIVTTEWRHTAIHHHIILNKIDQTTELVRKRWTRGRPRFTPLDDSGDYIKLAEYFVKETSAEKIKGREKGKQSYSCSRNLIIPKPKIEKIRARDFVDEPKPIKGYYIIKDSVVNGISPFGYKYQYYTMAKIQESPVNTGEKRRKNGNGSGRQYRGSGFK